MRKLIFLTFSVFALAAFNSPLFAQDAASGDDAYEQLEDDGLGEEDEIEAEDAVVGGVLGGEGLGDEVGTATGDVLESTGDLREDTGEAMYFRSLAAEEFQEAIDKSLDNRRESIKSYFEMRDLNEKESERFGYEKDISPQLAKELAKADAPDRLTSKQLDFKTGDIRWPKPLDAKVLKQYRKPIEETFRKRYQSEDPYTKFDHYKVRRMTDLMEEALELIEDRLVPAEYTALNQYLESISYESRFNRDGERVDLDMQQQTSSNNRSAVGTATSTAGNASSPENRNQKKQQDGGGDQ